MSMLLVVMSGLPGSGKSTLAGGLASALSLPLLDKDDVLEVLLDSPGTSAVPRAELSRAADAVLQRVVRGMSTGAVVVSFWRYAALSTTSGTPTQWLAGIHGARIVEVFCDCPPALAADRFLSRTRHPGHGDATATREATEAGFQQLQAQGPLGIGRLVRVATSRPVDVRLLAEEVARV
jgi:glucokinase